VTLSFDLKNPNNQRMALAGIVLIFLIYLWYSQVYSSGAEKIKARKGEYQVMVRELVEVKAKAAPLEDIRREYQAYTVNLQPLERLLPEEEYVEGEFVANDFRMRVEGTYHDFGRFLARVANFPFIARVSQMNLKTHADVQAKGKEGEKTVLAGFVITTYNASSNVNPGTN